ncbi:MAG TPA: iron-containing alcohol dehydrogenase, partial [Rhizobiales bacterium]|nr:iron-containing alcohol dehydrogenase [Hyphomicrobiales bacterium]
MNDVISGNWNYPTQIKFGPGIISELAATCRSMGIRRPLLVTDEGLAEIDFIKAAISANEEAGVPTGLFSDVKGNPVGRNITDGVAAYRSGDHDGVIAFGGGSGVDAGKAIALMV